MKTTTQKINFAVKLTDQLGHVIQLPGPKGAIEDLTLAVVATRALNAPAPQGQPPLGYDEAFKRGALIVRIGGGGVHEIDAADLDLIRQTLPLAWAPLVVVRAAELLKG